MAYDVFVSYAFENKPVADTIVHRLEAVGIRCWYAPRDPSPGANYASEIVNALVNSRVMVLVLSAYANESRHVRNEVEHAVQAGITVIPMRIEDVLPSPDIGLHISSVHWLNALTLPLEQHVDELLGVVLRICDIDLRTRTKPAPPPRTERPTAPPPQEPDPVAPDPHSEPETGAERRASHAMPGTQRGPETTTPGVSPPRIESVIGLTIEHELPGHDDFTAEDLAAHHDAPPEVEQTRADPASEVTAPNAARGVNTSSKAAFIGAAAAACVFLVLGVAWAVWPRGVSAGTPEAALDSFCAAWVEGDYGTMYGLLSQQAQRQMEAAKWEGKMAQQATLLGLPVAYRLDGPVQNNGDLSLWNIWLTHEKSSVGELRKQLWLIREAEGYRLREGPERFPPKRLGSDW